jgi:hypothetical protein
MTEEDQDHILEYIEEHAPKGALILVTVLVAGLEPVTFFNINAQTQSQ